MNCFKVLCVGIHAAVIKSDISLKEQDRNWRCGLDEIRWLSPKERCQHWNKLLQPLQRYGDKYNGVFAQQMIIMEAFFNVLRITDGNQIKHCESTCTGAEITTYYCKVGLQLTELILFRQVNKFRKYMI